MSLAGGESLHAAGVHAGNQTLDLWINLKITFSHGFIFPDKAGIVTDVWGAFPCLIKIWENKNKGFTGEVCR